MNDKLSYLINTLKGMQSALLAYSGGADSTLLLKALQLSGIKFLAVTTLSEITPYNELLSAQKITEEFGVDHMIIKTDELSQEEFVSNTPDRCYFCKDEQFKKLSDIALSKGYMFVVDASNTDDSADFRPGRKAAQKHNVKSPLQDSGFSKKEIREYSKQLGLPTWNKPSSPCLASRIPYGQRITKDLLKRIEDAEEFIKSLGFHEIRVRAHSDVARIEVEENKIELLLVPETRKMISKHLKTLGYKFISLDLDGYKSGSLNRVLKNNRTF